MGYGSTKLITKELVKRTLTLNLVWQKPNATTSEFNKSLKMKKGAQY